MEQLTSEKIEIMFIECCSKGILEEAKRLYKNFPINYNIQYAFEGACKRGQLEVAKWLHETYPRIDIHLLDERIFRLTCANGRLETAKWLLNLDQNIDIHIENEHAFRSACAKGHLEVAKWLWQLGQNINMCAQNDEAFKFACQWGNLKIAQWLSTSCNDYLMIIENGKIIKWLIKDENYIILELIENNKYDQAIQKLNIKSMSTEENNECIICHDEPTNIIQLPCRHTLCLEAIVRFMVINSIKTKKCFYCQKEYQWSQCVAIATSLKN